MAQDPISATDDKELKKHAKRAQKQILKMKKFIALMENQGLKKLKYLPNILKEFQIGLKEGQITAESAKESSKAVKEFSKAMINICKQLDDADEGVCEAQEAQKYQFRNVVFVIGIENKASVLSKAIKKSMKEWAPEATWKLFETLASKAGH